MRNDEFLMPFDEDLIQNDEEFQAPPTTSLARGFKLAEEEGIDNAFIMPAFRLVRTEFDKHVNPGRLMSIDDYKKSDFFRKGIDINKLKVDDNLISENLARLASEQHDKELSRLQTLERMKPGFLSGSLRFAGENIGAALDPGLIVSFGLTSKILGKGAAAILSRVNEAATPVKLGAKFALGSSIVGTSLAPSTAINYASDEVLGENPSAAAALSGLLLNAGLGGVIHGAVGFNHIVDKQQYMQMRAVAASQLMQGKSVRVQEILDHAFNMQRDTEDLTDEDTATNFQKSVEDKLQQTRDELEQKENEFQKKLDKNFIENINKGRKVNSFDTGVNILKRQLAIDKIPESKITESDRAFLKAVPETEELKRAFEISKKADQERTTDEVNYLKAFLNGKEPDLIKERLDRHQSRINEIRSSIEKEIKDRNAVNKSLDRNIEEPLDFKDENDEIEGLQEKIRIGKARLKDLNRRVPKEFRDITEQINRLRTKENDLKHIVDSHEVAERLARSERRSLTFQDIKDASDKLASSESRSAIEPEKINDFKEEVKEIPEKEDAIFDSAKNQADTISEDSLSEEDKQNLEEIKILEDMLENSGQFEESLNSLINCMLEEE